MKLNKLVTTCLIVGAAGMLIGGIGLLCGGRVYGIGMSGQGIYVNSNEGGDAASGYQYVQEDVSLEEFSNLKLDVSFVDVNVIASDHYGLEYCVREDRPIEYGMQNGMMTIIQKMPIANFSVFSIGTDSYCSSFYSEYVNLYLPKEVVLDQVTFTIDSGDMVLEDFSAKELTLDNSFGSIEAATITVETLNVQMDSGDFTVAVLNADTLTLNDSFGGVTIENAELGKAFLDLDSGDLNIGTVQCNDLQAEIEFGAFEAQELTTDTFTLQQDSGECTVERLVTQKLDADNSFGDMEIGIVGGITTYSADVSTDFGEVTINREDMGTMYKTLDSDGKPMLIITCDSGDVTLYDVTE